MSFSGTPLGQGRRLDHHTFLGKPPSNATYPPSSYAYGAPALGSRSPPKPTSPSRSRNGHTGLDEGDDEQETTLQRFAKLKQRESAGDPTSRAGSTKNPVSNVDPTRLPPDTSVNTANALFQAAANSSMSSYTNPHNASWASSSREKSHVPRSTSQEYENTVGSLGSQAHKRLAAPPDKLGRGPPSTTVRKPPSKSTSTLHVPDSEGEGDSRGLNGRARSPLETSLTFAKNALGAAAFYVRQRSREPEDRSTDRTPANGTANGNDSSYDYAEEEQAYQSQKRNNAAHKRNRMSLDNKAYKPTLSEEEESEYSDDDKTRRRRKKKKGPAGGPLTSLPVVGADKRRRRKGHGPKGAHDGPDADDDDSDSEDNTQIDIQSAQLPSTGTRTSNPPHSRTSASRFSLEPHQHDQDDSLGSAIQGLDSIPEIDEGLLPGIASSEPPPMRQRRRSRSRTPAPHGGSRFSIGGLLGSLVHVIFVLTQWTVARLVSVLSMFTFLFGQVFGTAFDLVLRRPAGWARSAGPVLRYLVPTFVIFLAWYAMQGASVGSYLPSLSFPSRTPIYHAPTAPPADISDLAQRLLAIENVLSGLSTESERTRAKTEDGLKFYADLLHRVSFVEGRLQEEAKKVKDVEAKARDSVIKTISSVKHDVDLLQSQLVAQQKQYERDQKAPSTAADEDARNLIKALEERLGSVEGGVKEALDLGKKAAAVVPLPAGTNTHAPLPGAAWWNKLVSGPGSKSVLQIKSADGQDVSALISHMVDAAVSLSTKDGGVARPDYALFSGGARVVPSLTTPQLQVSPRSFMGQVKSLFTGFAGYEALPPVVALHPDVFNGRCYAFGGAQGQLGVQLVVPVYVEEVTVDHVAKELAYDLRSAPREMEVWGLLEGQDNIEKVAAWRAYKAARREEAEASSSSSSSSSSPSSSDLDSDWDWDPTPDSPSYPPTLPTHPSFIRLANFTYDVHASKNVQTFPVDPEIRELGVDFGFVVLRVLSNWGQGAYTCLYRFRVHGTPMGEVPVPGVAGAGEGGEGGEGGEVEGL